MPVRTRTRWRGPLRAIPVGVALVASVACAAPSDGAGVEPTPPPNYYRIRSPWLDPEIALAPPRPQETSHALAALEVVGVNAGIWAYDRYIVGQPYAYISPDSWAQNLRKGWIIDTDDFWVNGLLHPVHGSFSYTAARAAGVGFYGSFGYTFAASFLWEEFAETQAPSVNDQINTPFGGTLFGEVRFRFHHLILDPGGAHPSWVRQILAFLVEPFASLNELAFHDRYRGPLMIPLSWLGDFSAGAVLTANSSDSQTGQVRSGLGPWALFEAHLLYGIPGTPGLRLDKPFDHFSFDLSVSATASNVQPALALLMRGLVVGEPIGPGGDFGGLWGLFTSYDFVTAQLFRVSGFALGPGITLMQRWGGFDLYGTALLEGVPWGAAGLVAPLGARDYQYGSGAEGLLSLRLDYDTRVTLRASAREFLVTDSYSSGQTQDVTDVRVGLRFRFWGPHAATLESDWSRRAAQGETGQIRQHAWTLSAEYTFLSGW